MSVLTRTKTKVAGLATVLAGLVTATAGFFVAPAQADNARAVVAGVAPGMTIPIEGSGNEQLAAPIFLKIDGKTYASYCIDFFSPLDWNNAANYIERDWTASPVPPANLGKVQWLLHNAFPAKTAEQIGAMVGVPGLTQAEAQAATQAVIWLLTDGRRLDKSRINRPELDNVKKAYHWFEAKVNDPATVLPAPTAVKVNIVQESMSGADGDLIGPFTMETTAQSVSLSGPNGVQFFATNDPAANAPITTVTNGANFFVKLAAGTAAGTVTIKASAKEPVQAGRIFVNEAQPNASQKLILAAATDPVETADTAKITIASGPKPGAQVSNACADGGVEVTLTNTGQADANFTVKGRDGAELVGSTKVAPGETKKIIVPATGSSYDFDVVTGSQTFKLAGARPCAAPKLSDALSTDCASGAVVVTLRNDGDGAGVVQVTNNGTNVGDPVTIAGGGSQSIRIPVANGQSYDVKALSGTTDLLNGAGKGTMNCGTPNPKASVSKDCTAQGLKVTLRNDGTAPGSFAVTNNGQAVGGAVTLAPGATQDVAVPLAEGAAYDVAVTSGTTELIREKGTFNCTAPKPTATLAEVCDVAAPGFVANLANTAGTAPATFEVRQGGSVVATETLAPGATKSVTVPVAAGTKIDASVTSGGATVAELKSDHVCPVAKPSATILVNCSTGAVATLKNDGNAPASFVVTDSVSGQTQTVTVNGGQTQTATVPLADGASYSITVTSGGVTMAKAEGTMSCVIVIPTTTTVPVVVQSGLTATAVEDCATGTVAVKVTNSGTTEQSVNVRANGQTQTVTVGAGATQTVSVPVAAGAAYAIDVTTAAGIPVANLTGTRSATCTPGSTTTVAGSPTTTPGSPTTAPGSPTTIPGSPTTVAPTVGASVAGNTVTVGGTQVSPVANAPRILPRTGTNNGGMILAGIALLGVGAFLLVIQDVLGSRRRA
jgi:TQXA domain-containing protein/LPXTG-motif cell wall-anchored protein